MAHKLGEPYSGKNPIPKITTGVRALVSPQKATEAKAAQMQGAADAEMEQESHDQEDRTDQMQEGRRVRVRDPVTGDDVWVRNAKDDVAEGDNILKLALPEPDWGEHHDNLLAHATQALRSLAITYTASTLALWILPLPRIILYPLCLIPPLIATPTLINSLRNAAKDDADARAWHSERIRGLRAGRDADADGKVEGEERMRESAEWANNLLAGVWPILNPSLFDSLVDMLEDIMQGSMPSFVHSVRVSDLGLGGTPLRITSVRALPDSAHEDTLRTLSAEDREQLTGDHVNLEISFAYRGVPSGASTSSKAQNAHLVIDFFSGVKEVWGFSFPVWVELKGVVGTARVRMQLIPDPPFIKTTLITLLGLPHITPSVTALSRALPNVMNLPILSGFISSALDTAAAEYVAPKSLVLDVQRLLGGGDVQKDTQALGVLVVYIHRATSIEAMDNDGGSDPYVTLTYAHLGKPLFSTRIIKGDLNPVFEETAILLVDLNIVKLQEKLSLQLWDSDRSSADDMMGFAEVDIVDLIRDKNTAHRRVTNLTSPDSRRRSGTLEYTIGYFAKLPPNPASNRDPDGNQPARDPGLPDDLEVEDPDSQEGTAIGDIEKAVLRCAPDDEWVSGLVAVQVHEVRDLGVGRGGRVGDKDGWGIGVKDKVKEGLGMGQEEGEKGDDDMGEEEEAEGLPSSYCMISLNDETIFKTRVKPITSSPIFNAGTERFVRDWRTAHVEVKVMDSRMRENDAVLGLVFLELSDLFVNAAQLTRVYHLEHGVGFGRVRISVLFRPVAAKLPPTLRGFDSGTLRIQDVRVYDAKLDLTKCELRLKTTTSSAEDKFARRPKDEGQDLLWDSDGDTEIPVRQRYAAALVIAFKATGVGLHRGKRAMSVLWLRDIADGDADTLRLPLWAVEDGDFSRLKQNYVPVNGNLDAWDSDKEKLRRVGTVAVALKFVPGVGARQRQALGKEENVGRVGQETEKLEQAGKRANVGRAGSTRSERTATQSEVSPLHAQSTTATAGHEKWRDSQSMVTSPAAMSGGSPTSAGTHSSQPLSNVATAGHGRDTDSSKPTTRTTQSTQLSTAATAGHGSAGDVRPPVPEAYSSMDGTTGHGDAGDGGGGNTTVPQEETETQQPDGSSEASSGSWVDGEFDGAHKGGSDGSDGGDGGDEGEGKKGPIGKIKAWKHNQRELGREHRGVMQAKPVRTAMWMKDNVKQGVHSVKDRFSMEGRQPDVETEV